MLLFLRNNWQAILAALLAAALVTPIAYKIGHWQGGRDERNAAEARQLLADAKNDVATVSAVTQVKKEYEPIYAEIMKDAKVPVCPVPAVIRDTINRLPDDKAPH